MSIKKYIAKQNQKKKDNNPNRMNTSLKRNNINRIGKKQKNQIKSMMSNIMMSTNSKKEKKKGHKQAVIQEEVRNKL